MTLKTGRKCTWEEIEVGEVFAVRGWCIGYKDSRNSYVLICTTLRNDFNWDHLGRFTTDDFWKITFPLYKLPTSIQNLWREL